MTAALDLTGLTTELITVLADETGLAVGDAAAPGTGAPTVASYPYLVVWELDDLPQTELMRAAPATVLVTWQIDAVGLTRVQAGSARDRARVLADPSVAIATDTAIVISRDVRAVNVDRADDGELWTASLRASCLVTAADEA